MTAPARAGTGIAALPAALRALADVLDHLLALTEMASDRPAPVVPSCTRRLAVVPIPDADEPERLCRWCHHPMPHTMRIDAEYCSTLCRKAAWRKRTGRS